MFRLPFFQKKTKEQRPVVVQQETQSVSPEEENDLVAEAVEELISAPTRINVTRLLLKTMDTLVKRAPTDCGWHVKIYSSVLFDNRRQYQVIVKATSNSEDGGGILEIGNFHGKPLYKLVFHIQGREVRTVRVEWKDFRSNNVYDLLEGFGKAFTIDNIKDLGFERLDPKTMLPLKEEVTKPNVVGVVVPLKR